MGEPGLALLNPGTQLSSEPDRLGMKSVPLGTRALSTAALTGRVTLDTPRGVTLLCSLVAFATFLIFLAVEGTRTELPT